MKTSVVEELVLKYEFSFCHKCNLGHILRQFLSINLQILDSKLFIQILHNTIMKCSSCHKGQAVITHPGLCWKCIKVSLFGE